jgi:hypothetical protein
MADDQLRPGQGAKITATPPLPAQLTDAILDSTEAELAAAAAQLTDDTRAWLEQVGALKPTRGILDLGHDQLVVISAVYGLVMPWWAQPVWRDRPLGQLLKVISADTAETVVRLLRMAGFLPTEPEE